MLHKEKLQKLHNSNVGVGEDKISNLPDELIHRILSLLPTKCAMSTCILSKRWNYVSYSIPTLDFREWRAFSNSQEEIPLKTQQFMRFLDTALDLKEKPEIQKFYLSWDHHFHKTRVKKWISTVIKRKVGELYLSIGFTTSFVFPPSFFTCDSLILLDLDRAKLNVPNKVSFPRLKVMRLRYMDFVNGISIEKLLSNCHILQELSLIHCGGLEQEVLCIAHLALKNLHIDLCYFGKSKVKIHAPNLSSISYGVEVPADLVIDSSPSLVEADIGLYNNCGKHRAKKIIKLFEKLSYVKLLKMSINSFQVLHEVYVLLIHLPAFKNLIHLEVSSEFDCMTMATLFRLLQLSPYLESIVFAKGIICNEGDDDSWSSDHNCSACSLLHLRSIKFNNFNGAPRELAVIGFFLKCAGVLETMTIVASPCLSGNYEAQKKATEQLLMFPRPINCEVKLWLS